MTVTRVYHALPGPVRSATAMARGFWLRTWRYGRETERLVEEAVERESWPPQRWRAWQQDRLASVLHRAATRVPYYRQQWERRRRRGDRSPWEVLENWPVLEKGEVRRNPRAFVADDCHLWRMGRESTSGSTGTPLSLWWSRETSRAWYALFEARWRRWHGVTRKDRWANVGGRLVVPQRRRRPPFWVWNPAMRQLYMSSYHLAPDLLPHYFAALRRYRVRYLYGYTSSLHALARYALRSGDKLELAVVLTNAEPLYAYQRDDLSEAFGCPVRETYGMSEAVAAAGECPHGMLHLWPEVAWIEVLGHDAPTAASVEGDLVCTGLLNTDMPLIRYRVGDRVRLAPEGLCDCRRSLPRLAAVEGRTDDVLLTADGRPIGRLDPVFKGSLAVQEAQIIQEELDRIRIRYVPAPGFRESDARAMESRLRDRVGPVAVILEPVPAIERGANGKLRAVVSRLTTARMRARGVDLENREQGTHR